MDQSILTTETMVRPTETDCAADGRRLRSERSRKAIVAALMSLIRKGETMPSAERVAEEANIGLRTVFRQFDDMDRLYQEVIEQIDAEIAPLLEAPYTATDCCGMVSELIERRAKIFELVMPFKLQAGARQLQSAYLQEMHRCAVDAETALLVELLPPAVCEDETLFAALSASLSLDVWVRLRKDQNKTPEEAAKVMHRTADALLLGV